MLAPPDFFQDIMRGALAYCLCSAVAYCNVSIHKHTRDGKPSPTLGLPRTHCHNMQTCPWRPCQQRR